ATTPASPEAIDIMARVAREAYGNPSSVHSAGQDAKAILEESREKIARILGAAKPSEIIFTSSGTESDNTAIKGAAFADRARGNHIITSMVEHHAVLNVCEYLSKYHGFEITYLPVDSYGSVDPSDIEKSLRDTTIMVSIMHANNEIGTIEPVVEIGRIIHNANARRARANRSRVYYHVDAVQTAGKIPLNAIKIGADFISISAHKFYGPKGVGCLYAASGAEFHPLLHGGHHEGNRRASTENAPGAAAMAFALETAVSSMEEDEKKILALRAQLERGIFSSIRDVRLNGHPSERLAGTLNVAFDYLDGESLVVALDMADVCVATGSACASGSTEPSHVITAVGCPKAQARGSVRFSLGKYNTEAEVNHVLKILPATVEKLREISPLYKSK
ncbi:MAG: cysteine desulfurase family protein, partial [Endomicrobiia bacterium]|nr:cysteine desulfurase family protein [Endomicrobiia bacterium]